MHVINMKKSSVPVLMSLLASVIAFKYPDLFQPKESASIQKVENFKFKNCSNSPVEILNVLSFNVSPDPVVLPGDMDFSFKIIVRKPLHKPIKVNVALYKQMGTYEIKIPCIDGIGSCPYDDLCAMLAPIIVCPDPFLINGIPCKCPVKPGVYQMKNGKFPLPSTILSHGSFKIAANMTMGGVPVACFEVQLTLA